LITIAAIQPWKSGALTMPATVVLGPFAMPTDRLLALIAILVFFGLAAVLTRRSTPSTSNAVTTAIIVGIVAARVGYVATHLVSFGNDPASVAAIWQGGFSPIVGIIAAAAMLALMLGPSVPLYRTWLALIVAVGLWAAVVTTLAERPTAPLPRGLTAYSIVGGSVPIERFRGKPFVVNLWATWCGPCQREMPMLVRAAAARPSVPILFVNQGESAETVRAFIAAKRLTSRYILLDPSQDFSRAGGSGAFPTTLFVGSDGTIRNTHAGEISRPALDDGIDDLLAMHL